MPHHKLAVDPYIDGEKEAQEMMLYSTQWNSNNQRIHTTISIRSPTNGRLSDGVSSAILQHLYKYIITIILFSIAVHVERKQCT